MSTFPGGRESKERADFKGMHPDIVLNNGVPIYWETENAKTIQELTQMFF